ncbi:MAG TPA: hypothetical protein DDW52_19725, partial [Planctomycetaceae bacterium]|nr:hypothetical protein [Planctomycetaceae bacterium]
MLRFLNWLLGCESHIAMMIGVGFCTIWMPITASAQMRPGQNRQTSRQSYRHSARDRGQQSPLRSVVSRSAPVRQAAHAQQPEVIAEGPISGHVSDQGYVDEFGPSVAFGQSPACDSCRFDSSPCGSPSFLLDWSRAELWAGTVAFTGPGNFLGNSNLVTGQTGGSFGFQEGFNFGARMPSLAGGQLGSQIGGRLTQTSLDGSTAGMDRRSQMFLTGGLFRRVDYGLQGGLVVD